MAHHLVRRVAVAVVAIPATVGLLYLGGWVLTIALAVVGVLGALELYRLAALRQVRALIVPGAAGAALLPVMAWLTLPSGYALGASWLAFPVAAWLIGVV